METRITSTEAARHLGDILARIRYTGESFLLTKNDKLLARLVPVKAGRPAKGEAIMAALERLPWDVDFADDLEKVNRLDRIPDNPWA